MKKVYLREKTFFMFFKGDLDGKTLSHGPLFRRVIRPVLKRRTLPATVQREC